MQLLSTAEMKEGIEKMAAIYHKESQISVFIHGILFVDVEAQSASRIDWRFVTRVMRSVPNAEILSVHKVISRKLWRCRIIIPVRRGDCLQCGHPWAIGDKYPCEKCGYKIPSGPVKNET